MYEFPYISEAVTQKSTSKIPYYFHKFQKKKMNLKIPEKYPRNKKKKKFRILFNQIALNSISKTNKSYTET